MNQFLYFFSLQVYWTHNGVQIEEDEAHTVEIIEDVSTFTTTLTVQAVTPQEAGTYKCVAINEAGEETVSASLIVKGMDFVSVEYKMEGTEYCCEWMYFYQMKFSV